VRNKRPSTTTESAEALRHLRILYSAYSVFKISSRLTSLCRETARRIEWSVPMRSAECAGTAIRCFEGSVVSMMMWLPSL
jgi:hypothetical protein